MTTSTDPPIPLSLDLLTTTELETAAYRQGYRIPVIKDDRWLRRRSTNAPGTLWLAGTGPEGPFFAATDHLGVTSEIGSPLPGSYPGVGCWRAQTIKELHTLVDRIYRLSMSLPTHPLAVYRKHLANELVLETETETMRKVRIGQQTFRDALMAYWKGTCPMTGISEPCLLRASHIRPWAECDDTERLDVHNGLLLSALWDAAFDRGLVSFDDGGAALFTPTLSDSARLSLSPASFCPPVIKLRPEHRVRLADHRMRHGFADHEGRPVGIPERSAL